MVCFLGHPRPLHITPEAHEEIHHGFGFQVTHTITDHDDAAWLVPPAQRGSTTQIDNWTGPYEPAADARARLRREWGIADDAYLIGALGRSEHSKGLDVLIQAFQQARPPGARLVIVGHGRDWQRLRALAGPDIVMPGFVARPQDCFAAFDAFVSAARSEPFGLVFLEAMAAGLPLLATASQGGQHFAAMIGRPLLPLEDVAALQAALLQLAAQRPPRQVYDMRPFERSARVAQETDEVEAEWLQLSEELENAG